VSDCRVPLSAVKSGVKASVLDGDPFVDAWTFLVAFVVPTSIKRIRRRCSTISAFGDL